MMLQKLLSVLIVLLKCSFVPCVRTPIYREYRLESLCPQSGGKRSVSLGKQPAIFTFSSHNDQSIQCHLELQLPSDEFGFYVFIESLRLSKTSGCRGDFLQFGRDFAFLTSYKSERYCDYIHPTKTIQEETEDGTIQRIEMGDSSRAIREYVETADQDMDIWISIGPVLAGSPSKQLKLVVTPFKKSCSKEDAWWWPCKGSRLGHCVRRDLLCDGVLNCVEGDGVGDEHAAVCITRVQPAGYYVNLPIVLISGVACLIGILGLLCLVKIVLNFVRKRQETMRMDERVKSEERSTSALPSAPTVEELPSPEPPSYSEAVRQTPSAPTNPPPAYAYSYPHSSYSDLQR